MKKNRERKKMNHLRRCCPRKRLSIEVKCTYGIGKGSSKATRRFFSILRHIYIFCLVFFSSCLVSDSTTPHVVFLQVMQQVPAMECEGRQILVNNCKRQLQKQELSLEMNLLGFFSIHERLPRSHSLQKLTDDAYMFGKNSRNLHPIGLWGVVPCGSKWLQSYRM